jgi:hypothetical protein
LIALLEFDILFYFFKKRTRVSKGGGGGEKREEKVTCLFWLLLLLLTYKYFINASKASIPPGDPYILLSIGDMSVCLID